jgi:hypothetical protein
LPVWTTTNEIGRAGKFADSRLPVQEPDRFATGPDGVVMTGAVDEEPHDVPRHTRSSVLSADVRLTVNF